MSTPYTRGPGRLNRRTLLTAAAAGVGASSLGGCANFTPTPRGPDDFVFSFWGAPLENEVVSEVLTEFCSSRGLRSRPEHVPGDYNVKINTLIAAGSPPDSGYMTAGKAMAFGEQGLVADMVGRPGFDSLLPETVHYFDDRQAIVNSCLEVTAMWFNRATTDAAGVQPPQRPEEAWGWEELIENATRLTRDAEGRTPDQDGFDPATVQQYGLAAPTSLHALQGLLVSNGTDWFSADGMRCNVDTPEGIEVIQSVADLIFEHRVAPTPAQLGTFGTSPTLLESGRVAMLTDLQFILLDLAATEMDYDAGVLPGFGGEYSTVVTSGACVAFNQSRHVDVASELVLQVMSDPRSVSLYGAGLWMPMQEQFYATEEGIAAWQNPEVHPPGYRTAVLEPTLRQATAYPDYRIRNSDVILARLNSAVSAMFIEPGDVAAQCRITAERINGLLRGVYPDVRSGR